MLDKQAVEAEVRENILPFWQGMADREHGGYYGEANFTGDACKTADKGGILHARILWTFSTAYRVFGDEAYLRYAERARLFLMSAFWDREHGGLYWRVNHKGESADTRKQFYNIAFGIYAFSEHYKATGDESSLAAAMELFNVVETYGRDRDKGGYIEACTREWQTVSDSRLSHKDLNSPKSMNTNLHVLEAYTNLARVSGDETVREALSSLIKVTLERIVNRDAHFELFFDMDWHSLTGDVSYGHDIEGSWLLCEAAEVLGDEKLTASVKETALAMAEATYAAGIDHQYGGLLSGINAAGDLHHKKEWWPQAEAVVGFYNAYELSGDRKFLEAAVDAWDFITAHFSDRARGEWHNELSLDNIPDGTMPKASFWKCPYHNSRACFEILARF